MGVRRIDEEISEVCCELLGERVFGGGVDGPGTDYGDSKGEEEGRQLDDEYDDLSRADDRYDGFHADG
jgi:hypothetical protein